MAVVGETDDSAFESRTVIVLHSAVPTPANRRRSATRVGVKGSRSAWTLPLPRAAN